jgi:hypothetical protein
MAKVYNFLMILAGISLLLAYCQISTSAGVLVTWFSLGNLGNLAHSSAWSYIGAIFSIIAIVGVIVGSFFRSSTDSSIRAAMCGALMTFTFDFVSIVNDMNSKYGSIPELDWIPMIVSIIYSVLLVGYFVSLVQFWGGNDI